jgi:asparagine synthase (glutamine-hydrolysing)
VAKESIFDTLTAGGPEWFRATDALYLRHRMQRWAGVTDTAVAYQRIVINPMLDENFLMLAAQLAPQDKAHSRFLASLQMELDPELGRMRLEGRPAPIAYAMAGPRSSARRSMTTVGKVARKVAQRVHRGNRAPAGGVALAAKVVEHWRENPEIVEHSTLSPFVRESWIDDVLSTRLEPRPSSVAFVTNLVVVSQGAETKY